jgi:hypothetical protein
VSTFRDNVIAKLRSGVGGTASAAGVAAGAAGALSSVLNAAIVASNSGDVVVSGGGGGVDVFTYAIAGSSNDPVDNVNYPFPGITNMLVPNFGPSFDVWGGTLTQSGLNRATNGSFPVLVQFSGTFTNDTASSVVVTDFGMRCAVPPANTNFNLYRCDNALFQSQGTGFSSPATSGTAVIGDQTPIAPTDSLYFTTWISVSVAPVPAATNIQFEIWFKVAGTEYGVTFNLTF